MGLEYDKEASEGLLAMYGTPDIGEQRRQVMEALRPRLLNTISQKGGFWVLGGLVFFGCFGIEATLDSRKAHAATYYDIDALRPIPQCAFMVLQTPFSGRANVGYPAEGWAIPAGQGLMEADLTYVLELLVNRTGNPRAYLQTIRDNPLKDYEDDPLSPANPTRAAVENDLNELLGML